MSQWAEMFASNRLHPNYWVNIAIFVQIVEWFWMNALIKQWMPWSTEYHANNSIQLSSNVGSELHQYQNMYLPLSCHELWVTPRRRRARMNSLSLSFSYLLATQSLSPWLSRAVQCHIRRHSLMNREPLYLYKISNTHKHSSWKAHINKYRLHSVSIGCTSFSRQTNSATIKMYYSYS